MQSPIGFVLHNLKEARHERPLADCFQPDARGRFLTPVGFTEATEGAEVAEQFRAWFWEVESLEIAESKITPLPNKLHLYYDIRVAGGGGWAAEGVVYRGEQQAYAVIEDGLIATLDLLCSGFAPVEPQVPVRTADNGTPPMVE